MRTGSVCATLNVCSRICDQLRGHRAELGWQASYHSSAHRALPLSRRHFCFIPFLALKFSSSADRGISLPCLIFLLLLLYRNLILLPFVWWGYLLNIRTHWTRKLIWPNSILFSLWGPLLDPLIEQPPMYRPRKLCVLECSLQVQVPVVHIFIMVDIYLWNMRWWDKI